MADTNPSVAMSREALQHLLGALLSEREVIGPVQRDTKFAFSPIENLDDIRLDYNVTLLPLRQFMLPMRETLFHYSLKEGVALRLSEDEKLRAIVGAHPYDIRATGLLDAVYLGDYPDPHYARRRENTLIIGIDNLCPSPHSFALSMGTHVTDTGFDLLLTDIGDYYVAAIDSGRGAALLRHCRARPTTPADIAKRAEARKEAEARYKLSLNMPLHEIPALLDANYDSPAWDEKGAKCLNCTSCTVVCPTCVCFDVHDEPELALTEGQRHRVWDSCMQPGFARVATGENFRRTGTERLRHRLHRKGKYLLERYGVPGCVGCGRCIDSCLPGIASPVDMFNSLKMGVTV